MTCPMKIRWGLGNISQCLNDDGHDGDHVGPGLPEFEYQRIHWQSGDRREFAGDWPGPCDRTNGCILHLDHLGRCAT